MQESGKLTIAGAAILSKSSNSATKAVGDSRRLEIEMLCDLVFGKNPERVAFPGGKKRAAFIADMGDKAYVLAKRDDAGAAAIEGIVMKSLATTGFAPRMVAVKDCWVVQEFVDGERLPIVLDRTAAENDKVELLRKALTSLALLHEHAHATNLKYRVPKIDPDEDWSQGTTHCPADISEMIGLAPPEFHGDRLERQFKDKNDDFIKGDARPGNAIVNDDRIVWFDWEGCGTRNSIDDLVYLVADEWTSISAQSEQTLITEHLPSFARGRSIDHAYQYAMAYGVFHICSRLKRAIRYRRRDGQWCDRERSLLTDKIGVTEREVARMCDRAARWSREVPELATFPSWFEKVMQRLEVDPAEQQIENRNAA